MGPELLAAIAFANVLLSAIQALAEGKQPTPEQQAALDISIAANRDELRAHVDRLTGRTGGG